MPDDFYTLLEEGVKRYLKGEGSLRLLQEILKWHREGGAELVEAKLRDRIILISEGYGEDVDGSL